MPAPKRKSKTDDGNFAPPRHEDCWAKTTKDNQPGINVIEHCLNVGFVAEAILQILPPWLKSSMRTQTAPLLAALHDIGKVSPGFQSKCTSWLVKNGYGQRALREGWAISCESDHAKIGQHTVQELLGRSKLHTWAAVIGAHHGKIKGERIQQITESNQAAWETERRRLAGDLMKVLGPLPEDAPDEATLWFVAGLVTFADWLGSNEDLFPQDAEWDFEERRNHARHALDCIGWKPVKLRGGLLFGDLFPGYIANPLQVATTQKIEDPGLYIIEGPMGSGKTEAALAAAYQLIENGKANGIYFALPTQVTSNRIYLRMQTFLQTICAEAAELRLAHSASWLAQTDEPPKLSPASPDAEAKEHIHAGIAI